MAPRVIIHFLTCIRESRESLLDGNQFSFNISVLAGLIDVKSNTLAGLIPGKTLKKSHYRSLFEVIMTELSEEQPFEQKEFGQRERFFTA